MNIGDKIRFARESAGLTQEELGKKCNTTKQTIYKYETGVVTNIPLDRLEQIAKALNVSTVAILGWDKKETLGQQSLTEGEETVLFLFRQIPDDQKKIFLDMIRVFADSLKKD